MLFRSHGAHGAYRAYHACAALLGAAALTAGCVGMLGPRSLELSQAQLQQALERQFPINSRQLELLDVHVDTPRVTLLPESNRLATALQVTTTERITRRAFKGAIAFNYALRYEPSDRSIRLDQVRVDSLQIDGAPPALRSAIANWGALIAERALNDQVIHTLREQDLKSAAGLGLQPGAITVTPRGLSLALNPVP